MSWEKISEVNKPCPCGNDTYTILIRSDDWSRFEESWVMNCLTCKERYTLGIKHIMDRDGLNNEVYYWKPKNKL